MFRRNMMYVSATRDGDLYFSDLRTGGDIARMEYDSSGFVDPVVLGPPVNTEGSELHPLTAPDES